MPPPSVGILNLEVIDNPQPAEKPAPVETNAKGEVVIDVVGEAWHTIQGEGPFAGRPAIFLRLAGCNLACPHCDTDYTTLREKVTVAEAFDDISSVQRANPATKLVVLTGGEPFRQAAVIPLIHTLVSSGYEVQIETNGSLWPDDIPTACPLLTIVCSPKTPKIHPNVFRYADAFKYVVAAGHTDPETGLPTRVLGSPVSAAKPPTSTYHEGRGGRPFEVYIQAEDDFADPKKTAENVRHAADVAMRFGYRMSVQLHKFVGLM